MSENQPYFAYGSNMDPSRMRTRCPDASPIGVALLPRWDVIINTRGVATIVPDDGLAIEGVLWSVTPWCLAALDRYEGVARGHYFRAEVQVRLGGSKAVDALTYCAADSERGEPKPGYLEIVLRGAEEFGVSAAHRQRLARLSDPRP